MHIRRLAVKRLGSDQQVLTEHALCPPAAGAGGIAGQGLGLSCNLGVWY